MVFGRLFHIDFCVNIIYVPVNQSLLKSSLFWLLHFNLEFLKVAVRRQMNFNYCLIIYNDSIWNSWKLLPGGRWFDMFEVFFVFLGTVLRTSLWGFSRRHAQVVGVELWRARLHVRQTHNSAEGGGHRINYDQANVSSKKIINLILWRAQVMPKPHLNGARLGPRLRLVNFPKACTKLRFIIFSGASMNKIIDLELSGNQAETVRSREACMSGTSTILLWGWSQRINYDQARICKFPQGFYYETKWFGALGPSQPSMELWGAQAQSYQFPWCLHQAQTCQVPNAFNKKVIDCLEVQGLDLSIFLKLACYAQSQFGWEGGPIASVMTRLTFVNSRKASIRKIIPLELWKA